MNSQGIDSQEILVLTLYLALFLTATLIIVSALLMTALRAATGLLTTWNENAMTAAQQNRDAMMLMCKSVGVFVDAANAFSERLDSDDQNDDNDDDDDGDPGDTDLFGPQGYTHPVFLQAPDSGTTDDPDNDPDYDLLIFGPPTIYPRHGRPTDDSTPNEPEPFPRPDPQTPEKDDVLREIAEMRDLQARIDAFARKGDDLVDNARQTGEMANALVDKLHDLSEGRIEKAVPCLNDGNGSWGVIAMGRSIFRNSRDVTGTLDRGLGEWFSNARKN